jgi:peptidoglycan/LPS O-acetylase OafA/YrhL
MAATVPTAHVTHHVRANHGTAGTGKLSQIEGLRGLAAIVVVAWHFVWAFVPSTLGGVAGLSGESGIVGTPLLFSINGPAAVVLFFLLSGFVVPLRFFHSGQSAMVLHTAAKRWLRLAGLSVLAVTSSYILFQLGLYRYHEAARLTGSAWLATFGSGDPNGTINPTLLGALREGLISAFVASSDIYDPVLWTMRHELLGSFLSLGMALLMCRARGALRVVVLTAIAAIACMVDPWLMPFVAGTAAAFSMTRWELRLGGVWAVICLLIGILLFGYLEPIGIYSGFAVLQDSAGYRYDRIITHTISSLLLLSALMGNQAVARAISIRPLLVLARLSFPIYLFHFPLLCSLACALYVALQATTQDAVALMIVALVYLPGVLGIALIFAQIDEIWAARVNQFTDRACKFVGV